MTPESCRAMARYNRWMNAKVYTAAGGLEDDERKRDVGAFFKSIHGTLNHLLVGDSVWLSRLTGVRAPAGFMAPGIQALDQELHADFDALRQARAQTDAAIDAWASTVTGEVLGGEMRYARRGQERVHPLWWAAMQMFNHGTHHRGQLTTLLFQANKDPGATDLLAMLLEEEAQAGSR